MAHRYCEACVHMEVIELMATYITDRMRPLHSQYVVNDTSLYKTLEVRVEGRDARISLGDLSHVRETADFSSHGGMQRMGTQFAVNTLASYLEEVNKETKPTPAAGVARRSISNAVKSARVLGDADFLCTVQQQLILGLTYDRAESDDDSVRGWRRNTHNFLYDRSLTVDVYAWRASIQPEQTLEISDVMVNFPAIPFLLAATIKSMTANDARMMHRMLVRERTKTSLDKKLRTGAITRDTYNRFIESSTASTSHDITSQGALPTTEFSVSVQNMLHGIVAQNPENPLLKRFLAIEAAMQKRDTYLKYVFSPPVHKYLEDLVGLTFRQIAIYAENIARRIRFFRTMVGTRVASAVRYALTLERTSDVIRARSRHGAERVIATSSRGRDELDYESLVVDVDEAYKVLKITPEAQELCDQPYFLSGTSEAQYRMRYIYHDRAPDLCQDLKCTCGAARANAATTAAVPAAAAADAENTEEESGEYDTDDDMNEPTVTLRDVVNAFDSHTTDEEESLSADGDTPPESTDWMLTDAEVQKRERRDERRRARKALQEKRAQKRQAPPPPPPPHADDGPRLCEALLERVSRAGCKRSHSAKQKRVLQALMETMRKLCVCLDSMYMSFAVEAADAHQMIISCAPWAVGNGAVARFVVAAMASLCALPPVHVDAALDPHAEERYCNAVAFATQQNRKQALAVYFIEHIRQFVCQPTNSYHWNFAPRYAAFLTQRCAAPDVNWFDELYQVLTHIEAKRKPTREARSWGIDLFNGFRKLITGT